ncbi:hypothetical protein J2T13_004929 [Paenibacillus sp. DS2015]|uniref:hypothetical protein n=1 Tax=Paenibacillus sp. DS2015 TaxID=3373917 RepID=UPI003D1FE01A
MNKLEVAKLYKVIKKRYSNFDASLEAVEDDLGMLKDIPYEIARANVRQHIMTNDFPPKISQIRGRLGEQLERQRMREETQSYFAQLELWKRTAVPPPDGMREALHAKLGRTRADRSTE